MHYAANKRLFENQAELHDYLKEHGAAWTYSLSWDGGYVSVGPYPNTEECDRQMAVALAAARYTPPRFWQFCRWGETRPSKRVLELLKSTATLQEGSTND